MLFFTGDQHLGHRNIIQHCSRPFSTVGEMDAALVARHNAIVGPFDTVLHLGDISWNGPGVIGQLNGEHYLVPGNHDQCHPCHKRHGRQVRRYSEAGITVLDTSVVQKFAYALPPVLLCHFPFAGDSQPEDRYTPYRPTVLPPQARLLLHGHVHKSWKRRGCCINVGVDVWDYAPVSVERLIAYCREEGLL